MGRISFFIAMMAFCLFAGAAYASQEFFQAVPDLPLMEGLVEMPLETVVFDKPQGRFVEVMAFAGETQTQDVLDFYTKTLPQMGWELEKQGVFAREGENLAIQPETLDGRPYIKFTVSPD